MLHSFSIGTPANRPVSYLSNDDIRRVAPAVFADQAHESRSSRYSYIPTATIIDGLRNEGFQPVKVTAARVRDQGRKGFEKHMIRFRQESQMSVARSVGDIFPEVVLVNSHDGSTSYKLSSGLFRLACSNGLVVPAGEAMDEVRITHSGRNIVHDVIEASFRVLGESGKAIETAGRWSQIQLAPEERQALAIGAHHLRFADAAGVIDTPITPDQFLRPRRIADEKNDLWTTFNRIQENAIKGGLSARATDAEGRRRTVSTREVKGIDGNVNLNKAIWKIAEHLAGLKAN